MGRSEILHRFAVQNDKQGKYVSFRGAAEESPSCRLSERGASQAPHPTDMIEGDSVLAGAITDRPQVGNDRQAEVFICPKEKAEGSPSAFRSILEFKQLTGRNVQRLCDIQQRVYAWNRCSSFDFLNMITAIVRHLRQFFLCQTLFLSVVQNI